MTRALPVALALVFALAFLATLRLERSLEAPFLYPQALLALVAALLAAVAGLPRRALAPIRVAEGSGPAGRRRALARVAGTVLLTVVYVEAWSVVGYFVATPLYGAALTALLGERHWSTVAALPLGLTVLVWAVLFEGLGVPVPVGPLGPY